MANRAPRTVRMYPTTAVASNGINIPYLRELPKSNYDNLKRGAYTQVSYKPSTRRTRPPPPNHPNRLRYYAYMRDCKGRGMSRKWCGDNYRLEHPKRQRTGPSAGQQAYRAFFGEWRRKNFSPQEIGQMWRARKNQGGGGPAPRARRTSSSSSSAPTQSFGFEPVFNPKPLRF